MENGQGHAGQLEHLDYGCQLISEIYGKPHIAEWTNSDYIGLSNVLYKKTRVQISPNTLKRIFGKIKTDARYYPQKATRDVLANYIGYPDWEGFVKARPLPVHAETVLPSQVAQPLPEYPQAVIPEVKKPVSKGYALRLLIGLTVLILLIGAAEFYASLQNPTPPDVTMVCRNPEGGNPHSAVFAIHGIVDADTAEPLYIHFGDGDRIRLTGTDSVISHYYEQPGRYYAELKSGKQVLDSLTVYLKVPEWTAIAEMMYDTTRVYPIQVSNLFRSGKNSVNVSEIARAGVDTNKTFFVHFTNSHPTGIDGDNFDLTTRVQTSPDRAGVRCSQVRLVIFGESSYHRIDVMKPGCLHWAALQFSETVKGGKQDDLDFLGADLRQGGTIRLKVEQRRVSFFIDDKLVHQTSYQHPLRQIYGVRIMFAGVGSIDTFSLNDLKTGKAFAGNF